MSLNNYEKASILIVLVIGLLGGITLVYFEQPPIISSIFIALGVSTVVYHFLGGIDSTEFNMGPIKLTGSIAALMASTWFINSNLETQIEKIGEANINSRYELFNSNKRLLGKLPIEKYKLSLNKDSELIEVYLNDSIRLGELKLGDLKLNQDRKITTLDNTHLGSIKASDFEELGLFSDFKISKYTEIKYKLRLSPFKAEVDDDYWSSIPTRQDFETIYGLLPFGVKPVFKVFDQTEIMRKGGATTYHPLIRGEDESIKIIFSKTSKMPKIYLVRIVSLIKNNTPKDNFTNSVIYQIYGFSTELK